MRQDKKVSAGQMTFILARGIGQSLVPREVEADDLLAALAVEIDL